MGDVAELDGAGKSFRLGPRTDVGQWGGGPTRQNGGWGLEAAPGSLVGVFRDIEATDTMRRWV